MMPELVYTLARTFFRMRVVGQREGAVTPSGGGSWGLLHTLVEEGPMTVPDIARSRPVSRQHIQRLADEAVAEGLVEFIDNPAHKRSKLARITKKGVREHDRLTARMAELGSEWTADLTVEDIKTTIRTLEHLRQKSSLE